MNRALWNKAVRDARWHLAISSVLLLLFAWLFVWLMKQFEIEKVQMIYEFLPDFMKRMAGDEAATFTTRTGQLSVIYVHVITLLTMVGWALGRGSSPISGEIGRGTMDLILSLPVRRYSVLIAPAVVATAGAAVLVASVFGGTWLGLLTVELPSHVAPLDFLPGAINLFCMVVAFTGITVLISTFCRDRWRAIVLAGGLFVVSLIVKMVWRLWPGGDWLKYLTFLSAYEPQHLIVQRNEINWLAPAHNLPLLGLGLAAYLGAAVVLSYRDIPAPK